MLSELNKRPELIRWAIVDAEVNWHDGKDRVLNTHLRVFKLRNSWEDHVMTFRPHRTRYDLPASYTL